MKNIFSFILILFTAACAQHPHDKHQFIPSENSKLTKHKAPVLRLADELVHELTEQNSLFEEDVPVVVLTPVMAKDFTKTTTFSAVLQQSLMTALKMQNYQVVDVNVTDALKVSKKGEFMLARDWQLLPHNLSVEQVLVSSIDFNKGGVVINSRVINVSDNSVLSAAEATMPVSSFSSYIALSEKVVVREGMIYRYSELGQANVRQLGVQ